MSYKIFLYFAFVIFPLQLAADETNIAVAANFTLPMKQIAQAFEKSSGHTVKLSFGSSGKIYAQIIHGAPFDAFLSADQAKPAKLEAQNQIVAGSRFTYAQGTLALWSNKPGVVSDSKALQQSGLNRVAIANPRLAPYGAAAIEVLEHLKLKKTLQNKLVLGDNIAQTYQFVNSGNAELGFVSLSQIWQQGELRSGSAWIIPQDLHSPIKQDAVLLNHGEHNKATIELLHYLRSLPALEIIQQFGYTVETQ